MNRQLRRLTTAAVLAVAPIGLVIVWLAVRADLPTMLATHFDLDGTPNGFQAPGAFFGWVLPVTAVIGAAGIVLVARLRAPGVPVLVGILGYVSWLFAGVGADTLLSAHGVADPHNIRSGPGHTVAVIVIAVVAGLLLWRLTPPGPRRGASSEPTPGVPIDPGERVVWFGHASSRVVGWIAGVLLVCGVVLLAVAWLASDQARAGLLIAGGSMLVVGLATGWCRSVHVRIDNEEVVVQLGGVPWPAFRTPMKRIEGATTETIEPLKWGGWGYRLSARGSAIVIRRGPGIVLRRTGGTDLAITVDDAETAAGLINGLLAVRR